MPVRMAKTFIFGTEDKLLPVRDDTRGHRGRETAWFETQSCDSVARVTA